MTTPTKSILIVDDDLTAITLTRAALQKAGFSVSTAVDGADGLQQFRSKPFDMVLLDVDMPGLSGYEVCATLRLEAGPLLPIVMVTGFDDFRSVDAAYVAGATDFIAKPINWTLLGHRVRYLLRGYQTVLDLRTAEARNSSLLAALPDLLFELDIEGRYVQYHPPRAVLRATPVDDFIGKTVEEVLSPESARVCRAAIQEAYRKVCRSASSSIYGCRVERPGSSCPCPEPGIQANRRTSSSSPATSRSAARPLIRFESLLITIS